jgi:hypothetical protein
VDFIGVTLDPGCLIDLEEQTATASYLHCLAALHRSTEICLRVAAIGASERQPHGIYAADFREFQERLAAVGLASVDILRPPFQAGLTFDCWSAWFDEEDHRLLRDLHAILFPEMPFRWSDFLYARGPLARRDVLYARWRATRCTVLALWCHVRCGGGIYVTCDDAFWRPRARRRLAALGAGAVHTPRDAATLLGGTLPSWETV